MTTTVPAQAAATSERRFFTGMAIALLAVVFVGFARSFYLKAAFPDWPAPPERFFALHGTVFSAWIALLVAQASLVAARRVDVHRKLGAAGVGLAIAMVVVGVWGALLAAKRATGFVGVPIPPLQFLAIPLFDMAMFPVFVALAIAWRGEPQKHKRAMVLATIGLTTAAIARWPVVGGLGPMAFFGLTDLLIVPLILWDRRTLGRIHPVTMWGGIAIVVSQPLRLIVSGTDAWLAFARWATGFVG